MNQCNLSFILQTFMLAMNLLLYDYGTRAAM